jgi:hypothetical protein
MGTSYDNTTIAVSLWGFSDIPWDAAMDEDTGNLTTNGGVARLKITNSGPILLTFICNATLRLDTAPGTEIPLGERIMVLQPDTTGTVLFNIDLQLPEGGEASIDFTIRAETFNGTYAGEKKLDTSMIVVSNKDGRGELDIILLAFGIIILILIVIMTAFVYIQFRKKDDLEDLEGVN